MQDVEQWLDHLDLRQYADTFAKNGVDSKALRLLTEQDLDLNPTLKQELADARAKVGQLLS